MAPSILTHFCLFFIATIVCFTLYFFIGGGGSYGFGYLLFVCLFVSLGNGTHGSSFGFYFKIRSHGCVKAR